VKSVNITIKMKLLQIDSRKWGKTIISKLL